MLVLDEKAMRSCVTCHDMIESVEKAFLLYAQKECNMIARMIASFGDNTMIYMPCQADGLIGTKILAAIGGLHQTVLRSKTDAMRSERTKLIQL